MIADIKNVYDGIIKRYHSFRGEQLIKRCEKLAGNGLKEDKRYKDAFTKSVKHFVLAYDPDARKPVKFNPLIKEVEDNWEKYRFQNREEADSYISWILYRSLKQYGSEKQEENLGLKGLTTPEQVFQRHPIEIFRSDPTFTIKPIKELDDLLSN